ncbi:hypothetical protein CLU79DRAFT_734208 [Phycomyces nitens]|nr:hypothetical protein CLU79DRAFT_734208 [Phycomyces nitens]
MVLDGMDMQAMNWKAFGLDRETFEMGRLRTFSNYQSIVPPLVGRIMEEPKEMIKEENFFTFKHGRLGERCSVGHFQLRSLLWATSKNDVYYLYDDSVRHWSPQRSRSRLVTSFPMKVISMICSHDILLVGGARGEYACRRLDSNDNMSYFGTPTQNPNGTTNHLDIIDLNRGGLTALISGNDETTHFIDLETMETEQIIQFSFPVNHTATSPDKGMLCAVGDSTKTVVADINNGSEIFSIDEHHDFSFSCCWSPDGRTFATGNQDKTTRVYDIRNTSRSLHLLSGKVGAIRSLQYSNDGKYLVASEHIDYIHVYDANDDYRSSQVINLFGSIAGVSLTPDGQSLFVANSDEENIG